MQNNKRRGTVNDDNYMGWLVKRKDPAYVVPVKILMIMVCIFSILSALQAMLGIIVMTIAGMATYFVFLNLSVEFEYLSAEGGLSVDRTLRKAKRKKISDCEKDDIQIMVSADFFALRDYGEQDMKVKDFSPSKRGAEVYALIYQKGPDYFKVLIEPSERMIGAMHRAFPWKFVM